jgi:hypothetical protein
MNNHRILSQCKAFYLREGRICILHHRNDYRSATHPAGQGPSPQRVSKFVNIFASAVMPEADDSASHALAPAAQAQAAISSAEVIAE